MSQLTIRKVDPDLVRRLKLRAARHERSAEAEVRAILEAALRPGAGAFWEHASAVRARDRSRSTTATLDTTELLRRDRDRLGVSEADS